MDDRGIGGGESILDRANDFYILHGVQIDSGAHRASYTTGADDRFPGDKAVGVGESNHSPPSRTDVRDDGAMHPVPVHFHGVMFNSLSTERA